jgi:hypothetical protein
MNDFLSSTKTFELKKRVAELIKKYDYPMVLNCVLHKLNIDHVGEILEMAERMEADYVELANSQFYSWAFLNRDQLLPTKEQLVRAEQITDAFREKVKGKMKLFFVMPDYYSERPKKCMNGWGNVFIELDTGQAEQVRNQAAHPVCLRMHDFQKPITGSPIVTSRSTQGLNKTNNPSQRGAQFMACISQEVRTHAFRHARFGLILHGQKDKTLLIILKSSDGNALIAVNWHTTFDG